MIYDTATRTLFYNSANSVRVSKLQHRLLVCLSSGDAVKYKDLENYVGSKHINKIKYELIYKTIYWLEIETIKGYGLILKSDILFM